MVFSEIPVGSSFCFGRQICNNFYRRDDENTVKNIVWRKTNDRGLSIAVDFKEYAQFDYPKPETGTNTYTRNHGEKFFFVSSIFKFLNTDSTDWWNLDNNNRPYNADLNGFLSKLNSEERQYLEPFTMEIETPRGYTKKYGSQHTEEVFVGLPTYNQMKNVFNIDLPRMDTWLADTSNSHCQYWSYGGNFTSNCDRARYYSPVIKIKDDAPVDVTSEGYVIRVPEEEFKGDIMSFLGFNKEAS